MPLDGMVVVAMHVGGPEGLMIGERQALLFWR